jgi:hypothetical protein
MKVFITSFLVLLIGITNAQLLSWSPSFIQENSTSIEITADANLGNQGLLNHTVTDVYVHIGAITTASANNGDWKGVPYTWGTTTAAARATSLGNNKWRFTITGGLRSFFNITNATERITRIAILFRSGDGNKKLTNTDGSDMFVPVYDNGTFVRIDNPTRIPAFTLGVDVITKSVNDNISITANANVASNLRLLFNGTNVATANAATTISANPTITASGSQQIIAEAVNGSTTVRDTINFLVAGSVNVAPLPSGVRDGINYETDATAVTLVLFAPNKTRVAVIGDFNNWINTLSGQMNRTPDGNRYWIRLTGLTAGQEYGYQYLIDGTLKVGDPYTEKVLDPWNDGFIPEATFPAAQRQYPTGKTTGIVSTFRTAKPAYNWQVNNFTRPNKRNLIVYELLVRDFVAAQNWKTVQDSIPYFKRLGINTIHVMPFNEFEGNLSWGYNPNYFFAPDKFYGTENALKTFIDECHKQGIAVVMDMVLNHAFGSSPMVQMYWDAANNRPAANSPWFNVTARHPFNVGFDFNHETQATRDFVDRVVEHWLTNYKLDGFRWDLSKGFTQVNSCSNANCDGGSDVGNWSNYDASRITIWKRIYDKMQATSANSYCILEHLGVNTEERELADYGMLLWGNANFNFRQAARGVNSNADFAGAIHTAKGWTNPHLMSYQESHDEERVMVTALTEGNSSGSYNIRDLNTALKRAELTTAFWAMMPGPRLMWQFGEMGYDFSINRCEDGTINNNCRLSNKPVRWDYLNNANRKALFDVYAKLFSLRNNSSYFTTFTTNNVTWSTNGTGKWMIVRDAAMNVVVIGNFDVAAQGVSVLFPASGTWYSVLDNTTFSTLGGTESIFLQPGQFYVYVDKNVNNIPNPPTAIFNINAQLLDATVKIMPNPLTTQATVQYEIKESGNVNMSIMDITGKKITNVFSGYKARGAHQLQIEKGKNMPTAIATGMYFLQVEVNGKRKVEKLNIYNK